MDIGGIVETLIYIAPAMAANGAPVVGSRILYGPGHPIDMGLTLPDGRRLLGDGKTFEGFIFGMTIGVAAGLLLLALLDKPPITASILSSAGALAGDIIGSFIKRRMGLERGVQAPLLDQLDFYIGALATLWLAGYRFDPASIIIVALVILVLHVATNRLAYLLGLKSVPW